ncbi:hypothetical protein CPLU01_15828 [Colletotrichum plurivorum]|uniref:Uncharacterized protein n=1 Tax=Colletotrichum plurivorum TaxID=2175906 RepID=A0A8H6J6X9_9PEZI|nr:hypothetical protein CPLU01_15828 [Colletotrichum plurivorum]
MSSTAHYHAIHGGGTEPPAGGRQDPATQSLAPEDDTDRDMNSGGSLGRRASRSPSPLPKGENEDARKEINLDPGFLDQEHAALKVLSWMWEIILTILPLFFIVLAILAAKLDGSPVATSDYGSRVVEITRLGPTIYPILFAMVAARFYKNAARYRLERPGGIRLSSLEQIFGSQSFASALERLIVVRAQLLLGALILSTWAMSPLGGQSSSRLLRVEGRIIESHLPVYYDNRSHKRGVWSDPDRYHYSASDVVQALYSGSLLSPKTQQRGFSDLWERPKIPQLPRNWRHEEDDESWRVVDTGALKAGSELFTSLIGLNIQSPDFSDNTTRYEFDVQSTYFDFECTRITGLSADEMSNVTFWDSRRLSNHRSNKTKLLDAIPRYGVVTASASFAPVLAYFAKGADAAPYVLHTSFSATTDRDRPLDYAVFNCTLAMPSVETKVACTALGCEPQQQRRVLDGSDEFLKSGSDMFQFSNALEAWPNMTKVVLSSASATENFIANDENAYANQGLRDWRGVDEGLFSSRLTTAFNTAWEAGIDPYNVTKGSSFAGPTGSADVWTNQTSALVTRTEDAYYLNAVWAAILVIATTVLQALAVGGLVLRCLIRGPDVLGFASSLTRDNRFVPVSGGSSLDGADRARSLRDVRVQFADVQPQESCGYVAFTIAASASDRDKKDDTTFRPLEKKRMYY